MQRDLGITRGTTTAEGAQRIQPAYRDTLVSDGDAFLQNHGPGVPGSMKPTGGQVLQINSLCA